VIARDLAETLMKNPDARVVIEEPWGDQYGCGTDFLDVKRVSNRADGVVIYIAKGVAVSKEELHPKAVS
jgi:hypothetical protein